VDLADAACECDRLVAPQRG